MELKRGDIVIERLTGKRAIVIKVAGDDEVTCRFGDGRLEDRYAFELEPSVPFVDWLISLVVPHSWMPPRQHARPVSERSRPILVRG